MKRKPIKKAHFFVSKDYLEMRKNALIKAGYPVTKWILFCEWALWRGLCVFLHEAHGTFSKYIYVSLIPKGPKFKLRFSNHKPSKSKEHEGECDFFVGVANNTVTTTADAIKAVENWIVTIKQEEICSR